TDYYFPALPDARTSYRVAAGLSRENIVGIIVGTDPVRKGLFTAIKAIELLNDPRIILVSIGFPTHIQGSRQILNLGQVDDEKKLKYLQLADFFIFPSLKEGFPISVLEAASVGLPLIVSKNSNASDLKEMVPYFSQIDSSDPVDYKVEIKKFINFYESKKRNLTLPDRSLFEEYSIPKIISTYSNAFREIQIENRKVS
ncbi:MAG: glycosyltransferase, partial [Thermoplasmatales archaeon]